MPEEGYPHAFDIRTALKVVRHISSGIYRDLGGSLKELVSNSFDVEARRAEIWTGSPECDTIRVLDDGNGMTADVFEKSFKHIGLSMKVVHPELFVSKLNRPTIGRFGIGFLAAAHISRDIQIRTFPVGQKEGIDAHLDLDPYFDYMDTIETMDEFKFGTVTYRFIDNPKKLHGSEITLRNVRKSAFHGVITEGGLNLVDEYFREGSFEKDPGSGMQKFVRKTLDEKVHSIDRLCGRDRILWHLGLSCPVQYLAGGPINPALVPIDVRPVIDQLRADISAYKFELWYDGLQVRKPILLPTPEPDVDTESLESIDKSISEGFTAWPISIDKEVGDGKSEKRVKARGYLAFQPYRMLPVEMRGIMPRVRAVGIGSNYEDNHFMKDLKAERPLFRVQVCGELYIDEGMDDALDLDRSGFMEVDAAYRRLAAALSDELRELTLKADKIQRARRERRLKEREEKELARKTQLLANLFQIFNLDYAFKPRNRPALRLAKPNYVTICAYPATSPWVVIDHSKRELYYDLEVENPEWIALAVYVDALLARLPNPVEERRAFAEKTKMARAAVADSDRD